MPNMMVTVLLTLLVPASLSHMVTLRLMGGDAHGMFLLIMMLLAAWSSDTGAYFAGMLFGKHKLAPVISPKKTIEGMVGGVIVTILGMVGYCLILEKCFAMQPNYWLSIVYGLAGALISVFGDLCFSVVKRQTGIKDYGNLIPGHGGILDRFDSMMLAGPLAEVLLLLIPIAV
jgi:phosphatidate cytidylyltransferase